jgi:hypothetical protein
MKMVILKFTLIVFAVSVLLACTQEDKRDTSNNNEEEQAAVQSAEKWLALVDEGKYGDSWDDAADVFKNAVTKDEWEEMLDKTRPPFGKVLERNLKTKSYKTSVPGVPDGEYVVIQFHTEYERKANTIETVTPSKEKDGNWRVAGYYIK